MPSVTPFRKALRRAVKILGSQAAASRATGIPQPTINGWLNDGIRRFPADAPAKFEVATGGKIKAREFVER